MWKRRHEQGDITSGYNPEVTMGSSSNCRKLDGFTIELLEIPRAVYCRFGVVPKSGIIAHRALMSLFIKKIKSLGFNLSVHYN